MKRLLCGSLIASTMLIQAFARMGNANLIPATGQAADAGITATRVLGQIVQIDAAGKRAEVKTDAGNTVIVILDEKTEFLRVPPGETSLEKAIKTTLAEIVAGDKVYVRGRVSDDHKFVPAQKLIVMPKADIEKKHEQERAEWKRRGTSGVITTLNPQAKEIVITASGREGPKPLTISVSDSTQFRRYAADSVKFSDAKSSSFAELKVGDQLRALGDKNPDGTKLTAEQLVSGSFKTIGGTVKAVSPDTGEIKIEMLGSNKPFTVVVNKDSLLRRIPPQIAMMLAMRSQGGPPPGMQVMQAPTGQQKGPSPQGGQTTGPKPAPQGGPMPQGAPNAAGAPAGMRMEGGGDFQDMLERMPPLTLADLKPGDVIAVSSTTGTDPSRLTAITLVGGVDAILTAMQRLSGARRTPSLNTGLPSGVLDLGIGLP